MMDRTFHDSARLVILGHDLDPDRVSSLLQLTPYQTWRRGERTRIPLPDGTLKEFESVRVDSGWKARLWERMPDEPFTSQIVEVISILSSRSAALQTLRKEGNEIWLDCTEGSTGSASILLPNTILALLSELSLDLEITVFRDPGAGMNYE